MSRRDIPLTRKILALKEGWLAAIVLFPAMALAQTPPPLGYVVSPVNLMGSDYDAASNAGTNQAIIALTETGVGVGTSLRLAGGTTNLGRDTFYFSGTGPSRVINLTGSGYEYLLNGRTFRFGFPISVNATGQVVGQSSRFNSSGSFLGNDIWFYGGSGAPQVIGLTGPAYQPGTTRDSQVNALNDAGQAIGISLRGGGTSMPAGVNADIDAWLFDGQTTRMINPTGTDYESVAPFRRTGFAEAINNSGQVIGQSQRYAPNGGDRGTDTWLYSGNGPAQIISMTGSGYEGTPIGGGTYRASSPKFINASGQVVGSAEQITSNGSSLGDDIWFYDGVHPSKIISLTGTGYEHNTSLGPDRTAFALALTDSGKVIGSNLRQGDPAVTGQDVWYYDGSGPSRIINLTGVGYEYSVNGVPSRLGGTQFISPSGQVFGVSLRYAASNHDSLGRDAWFYSGSGVTRIASLTGPGYERTTAGGTYREGQAFAANSNGQAVGTNSLYGNGNTNGHDTWLFDGSSSRAVNLAGPGYEFLDVDGVHRESQPVAINDAGQAIGFSDRFDPTGQNLGYSGWFFDAQSGITTPLEFSFNTHGACQTGPAMLTPQGVVLGEYALYNGDLPQFHAFWWGLASGFHDLGELISGGLAGSGWDSLRGIYDSSVPGAAGETSTGAPAYIVGSGRMTQQGSAADTIFMLSAQVPEPGHLVLLSAALFACTLPRRRKSLVDLLGHHR